MSSLHPRLIVADVDSAVEIYVHAFDAEPVERFVDQQGRVVHAAVSIRGSIVSLAQSVREWGLLDPKMLGGSASLVHLEVEDPDATAEAVVRQGGEIKVPIADRPWGKREGRVIDAAGHLWVLSKRLENLSAGEISRRMAL